MYESNSASLDKNNNTNSLETTSLDHELILSSEITSDSDISLVNCYDVTQSVVYKKQQDDNEEVQTVEQTFGFESSEPSLTHEEVSSVEPESVKPVAKPRTQINSISSKNTKMQNIGGETDVKLTKYKESEDAFDTVPYVINKRSDNTLIRKIYSDPSVRSFALNNRNKLPISVDEPAKYKKKQPLRMSPEKEPSRPTKTEDRKPAVSSPKSEEIKLPSADSEWDMKHADNFHARVYAKILDQSFESEEKEINELKEQKLVSYRLKQFSKSSINLTSISDDSLDQSFPTKWNRNRRISIEMGKNDKEQSFQSGERSTSVKDLRKKFEQFDVSILQITSSSCYPLMEV